MLRIHDLHPAFDIGPHAVPVWGYVTHDALEEVLAPQYFRGTAKLLEPGDLIYVCIRPKPDFFTKELRGERRTVLLMVSEIDVREGETRVRLVQDFGLPKPPASAGERNRAA